MRNHLWLVHKSYHMSYKYYIKTMRKCAKYHTTLMFPQHDFTIIYWQEHNAKRALSELGERTTTTRFGLKRRPVDHLDGHDMTHF